MVSAAEASRIGRALESVSGWSSEIVVVLNNDANDGTEEIARKHGAKVWREPWKGFVGQKNSVSDKATQPWLLNLDADECVSEALALEISQTIQNTAAIPAAYEFPRCTYYCGRWIRHGDWYPDRVCRLWQRGRAHWVGQEPHARLQVDGTTGRLGSDLLHYSNESIERQIAKIPPYHKNFVQGFVSEGRHSGLSDLLVRPWWRFMRGYLFRRGFLDGWQGFYIARLSAFSTLTKYAMVREARRAHTQEKESHGFPGTDR